MNKLFMEETKYNEDIFEEIFADVDENIWDNIEELEIDELGAIEDTEKEPLFTVEVPETELVLAYMFHTDFMNYPHGQVEEKAEVLGISIERLNELNKNHGLYLKEMLAPYDTDEIYKVKRRIKSITSVTIEEENVNDIPDLPLFPTEVFPPVLKDYVEAVAESLQVPVDVPSVLVFPVVAALSMRKFKVSPKRDWIEEVCIYSGALAAPGSKKSAVFSNMIKPIQAIQKESVSTQRIKRTEYESNKKILTKKIDKLEQDLIKLSEPDAISNCTAVKLELIEELATLPTVSEGQMIVEDITPEALATTLANNDEKISLFSPEGGFVTGIMGRYSNDPNIDIYLKGFDGESHTVTRSSKKEYLENPCLNIGALFQPAVIKDFTDYATSRGLPQRFLMAKPKYNVGYENLDSEPVSEELKASYNKLLNDVHALNGCILTFDNAAVEEFNRFRDAVQKQMRKGELFGDSHYCEWMSKLAGKLVRLLALIHITENHDKESVPKQINLETAKKVWPLFEYYSAHYLAIYGKQKEQLTSDETAMLNFISKHNVDGVIKWKEIQKSNLKRKMNAKLMKTVLATLVKKDLLEVDKDDSKVFYVLGGIKEYA